MLECAQTEKETGSKTGGGSKSASATIRVGSGLAAEPGCRVFGERGRLSGVGDEVTCILSSARAIAPVAGE